MEKIKMPQPLVSIILPTYNVYPYLTQCLDSILAQTYKNIEVIIVIDGATDGSYELAKEYANKDNRFCVYWQENKGSGPARNNGLNHANGKFVLFIDPDDWIKSDYVEQMLKAQKEGNYDLVATTSEDYYFTKDKVLKYKKYQEVKNESYIGKPCVHNMYALLFEQSMICAPTKILYKMDIIKQYNVTFPNMRRSQDIVFNYRYYDCISSVRVFNYHGYCYRIEFSQWLNRLKPDYYKTIKFLFSETKKLHEKWGKNSNIVLISTIYTKLLSAAVESCVAINQPIDMIIKDMELQKMVRFSKSTNIPFLCFKIIFMLKATLLMNLMMKVKHKIKLKYLE